MARNLEKEMIDYCHGNQLEEVKACLTLKVDVNTVSEDGRWSGLTIAAKKNNPALLEILLSHPDVQINNTTLTDVSWGEYRMTPLMFACHAGNSAIVSGLVQVPGLDLNYQDEDGDTAALLASGWSHTECVRILAQTGRVDWNKGDRRGLTPLHLVLSEQGHSDMVDIIVQQPNIDFSVRTESDGTLAQAAVWGADLDSIEILSAAERCNCWNVPDSFGNTPIMMAFNDNNTEIVEILARCPRVDLNLAFSDGETLVEAVVRGGDVKGVESLAVQGRCDWNVPNKAADTPVMVAIREQKLEILEILLTNGRVNYDIKDKNGDDLITIAYQTGNLDIVKLLEEERGRKVTTVYAEKIAVELECLRQNLSNL